MDRVVTGQNLRRLSRTSSTNGLGLGISMSENGERRRFHTRIMGSMLLDADQCYRALRTHDARFDGRFFVGVATTRIYCRPVCSARTPHREHCRFFASAAAAESEGFRPCLRCRPEMARAHASVDATRRLAQAAADLIDERYLT